MRMSNPAMDRLAPLRFGSDMTTTDIGPTLVLGATGTTGRRVADRLAGRVPVRPGSRSGHPPFDWTDEGTWPGALAGITAVYLVYQPDLVAPGAVDTVRRFVAAAGRAGVRRLVLLSGRGEPEARAAEQVVLSSGLDATVVRSAFFAQNFDEKDFVELIRAGTVALPVGPVAEPFVDADDIADVVVAALTEDGHAGQVYEVTGPRLLTFAAAVDEIAAATGRPIDFVQISADEFAAGLTAEGTPTDVVEALTAVFSTVLDGRNAILADGVPRALGRPPRDFADYAHRVAATGAWDAHG